jgi:hypothetical protein
VWDDHDYGGNDADASSPSRPAAQSGYRLAVPHGHLAAPPEDGAIYHAFTAGRLRVVVTDNRSHRNPDDDPDEQRKTMLGEAQLTWFESELRRAAEQGLAVVWANATPWIDAASPDSDSWGGFAEERERIATLVRELGIADRMLVLGGDAHMIAFDDGTHAAYAGEGSGFPVVHSGALDRPGGEKGGPYTVGPFPGAGQYGSVAVEDGGGDEIRLRIRGRTWDGRELIDETVGLEVSNPHDALREP